MRGGETPPGYTLIRHDVAGGHLFGRADDAPAPPRRQPAKAKPAPRRDFEALHRQYRANVEPGLIADLADAWLGLSGEALDALEPGWSDDRGGGALILPERDAAGRVVGLQKRFGDGAKRMVTGSARGLAFAPPLPATGVVYVVEGASDAAAAMQAGFVAVGRPSNCGGGAMLAELLADRDVIVLGENDAKPHPESVT